MVFLTAPYILMIAIVMCAIGYYDGHITYLKLKKFKFNM